MSTKSDGISKLWLQTCSKKTTITSTCLKDQEWAADWKEVNDIMQPLIQTHEAGIGPVPGSGTAKIIVLSMLVDVPKKSCSTSANWVEFLILNNLLV